MKAIIYIVTAQSMTWSNELKIYERKEAEVPLAYGTFGEALNRIEYIVGREQRFLNKSLNEVWHWSNDNLSTYKYEDKEMNNVLELSIWKQEVEL